jgi:hypothetical protein
MSWYNNSEQTQATDKVGRFLLMQNNGAEITFLDEATVVIDGNNVATPIKYSEYRIQIPYGFMAKIADSKRVSAENTLAALGFKEGWNNYATATPSCPLSSIAKPSAVAVFSVIDHSSWTSPKGKVYKDLVKLFVVKRSSPTWGIIQKQIEKRGGSLRGCRYSVERIGDKSSSVGNVFEFVEKVDATNLPKAVDYGKVLSPKNEFELSKLIVLLGGQGAEDHEDTTFTTDDNDDGDVPF